MDIVLMILFLVFGTLIGSYLNVVVLRYGSNLSTTKGRSMCFSCGKTLHWYELIPILSFLIQGGKCRGCKSRISWQYPIVEFLAGVLFVLIFLKEGFTIFLPIQLFIWCILLAILVYDLRHMIIPDGLVALFILASIVEVFSRSFLNIYPGSALDIFAGVIFFIPFFALWFFSMGTWIGLGDGKLSIGIGTLLGIAKGIAAIILSFWIGAIVGILLLAINKIAKTGITHRLIERIFPRGLNIRSEIPFAPFLIAGTFVAYYFSLDILQLSTLIAKLYL